MYRGRRDPEHALSDVSDRGVGNERPIQKQMVKPEWHEARRMVYGLMRKICGSQVPPERYVRDLIDGGSWFLLGLPTMLVLVGTVRGHRPSARRRSAWRCECPWGVK